MSGKGVGGGGINGRGEGERIEGGNGRGGIGNGRGIGLTGNREQQQHKLFLTYISTLSPVRDSRPNYGIARLPCLDGDKGVNLMMMRRPNWRAD